MTTVASYRPVCAPHPPQPWPWSASTSCPRTSCWRCSRTCPPASCCGTAAPCAASGATSLTSCPSGSASACGRATSPRTGTSLWPTGRSSTFCAVSAGTCCATHVLKVSGGCLPPFPEPQDLCACCSHTTWTIPSLPPTPLPQNLSLSLGPSHPSDLSSEICPDPASENSAHLMSHRPISFLHCAGHNLELLSFLAFFFFPLLQISSSWGLTDLATWHPVST